MKRNQKGFTLVELIIVIAIIAILAAVLAPQYIKYIAKSQAAVCLSHCDELQRALNLEATAAEGQLSADQIRSATGLELQNVADPPTTGVFKGQDHLPCPKDGNVSFTYVISGGYGYYTVACEEHGKSEPTVSDRVLSDFSEMTKDHATMTAEDFKKKYPSIKYVSNDTLRRYYYETVLGGSWEKLTVGDSTVYLQPYYDISESGGNTPSGDVILFANSNNQIDKGNWNASYVYYDGKWYGGKGTIMVHNMSSAELKQAIDRQGWEPVAAK